MKKRNLVYFMAFLACFSNSVSGVSTNENLNILLRNCEQYKKDIDLHHKNLNAIKKVQNRKNICLIGDTKGGKDSLLNLFFNRTLLVKERQDGSVGLFPADDILPGTCIGDNHISTTIAPIPYIAQNGLVAWTCPGFGDNRGVGLQLLNASFMKDVYIGETKLVLLINTLANGNRNNFIKEIVKKVSLLDNRMFFHTVLVWSKIDTDCAQTANAVEDIENWIKALSKNAAENAKVIEFLEHIKNHKEQIAFFPAPEPEDIGEKYNSGKILNVFKAVNYIPFLKHCSGEAIITQEMHNFAIEAAPMLSDYIWQTVKRKQCYDDVFNLRCPSMSKLSRKVQTLSKALRVLTLQYMCAHVGVVLIRADIKTYLTTDLDSNISRKGNTLYTNKAQNSLDSNISRKGNTLYTNKAQNSIENYLDLMFEADEKAISLKEKIPVLPLDEQITAVQREYEKYNIDFAKTYLPLKKQIEVLQKKYQNYYNINFLKICKDIEAFGKSDLYSRISKVVNILRTERLQNFNENFNNVLAEIESSKINFLNKYTHLTSELDKLSKLSIFEQICANDTEIKNYMRAVQIIGNVYTAISFESKEQSIFVNETKQSLESSHIEYMKANIEIQNEYQKLFEPLKNLMEISASVHNIMAENQHAIDCISMQKDTLEIIKLKEETIKDKIATARLQTQQALKEETKKRDKVLGCTLVNAGATLAGIGVGCAVTFGTLGAGAGAGISAGVAITSMIIDHAIKES